ncbi:thiamine-phosphate kinase [Gordonia sp. NPDC003585]|uniref:thiamine-phosphate kinase n=1 Tax=Gordonia sp. NPDC003585 TaxID=3154275 RepID=UPI0033B480AB
MTAAGAGKPESDGVRTATVGEIGERAMIAAFTAQARGSAAHHDIVIGSGDDAAVIDTRGVTVISTDTAVEGRHFRFDWSSAQDVGARAIVQSAADIAAMGGRTTGVVVSIAAPPSTLVGTLLDLNMGMVDAAHRLGARVLGGDLVAAQQVVVSVTAVGAMDGTEPVVLGGANPGDVLAVSGPVGACAAGLAVLSSGDDDLIAQWQDLVAAYRIPSPDLTQGPIAAAAGAHAMTDISDGLVEELITMAQASGTRLSVRSGSVPRHERVTALAEELGTDVVDWVLAGGEDHELLAAFDADAVPAGWTVIGEVSAPGAERAGRVSSAPGVERVPADVLVDGRSIHAADGPRLRGWESFSA